MQRRRGYGRRRATYTRIITTQLTIQLGDAGSTRPGECRYKQVSARHGLDYNSNTTASDMMIVTLIAQLLRVVVDKTKRIGGKLTSNLEAVVFE